jgi:hypothetical protein
MLELWKRRLSTPVAIARRVLGYPFVERLVFLVTRSRYVGLSSASLLWYRASSCVQALCRRMAETEEHVAGLNPRSFRKLKDQNQTRMPEPENIVDLDLLSE